MTRQAAEPPFRVSASAVALGEHGVLIRGRSGAGKSSLALALVEAWRRRGDFARLIGDDCVIAHMAGGRAVLAPHHAIAGLAEWRGIGLLPQDFEGGAVLALIVDLEPEGEGAAPHACPNQRNYPAISVGYGRFPACVCRRGRRSVRSRPLWLSCTKFRQSDADRSFRLPSAPQTRK